MGQYLRGFPLISATDAGQMEAALRKSYGIRFFDLPTKAAEFRASANHWQYDSHVGLSYCEYDTDVDVLFPATDLVRVHMGLAGSAEQAANGNSLKLTENCSLLVGPNSGLQCRFQSGFRQLVWRIEQDRLRRLLAALTDQHVAGPLTFQTSNAANAGSLPAIRQLTELLVAHLDNTAVPAPSLLQRELIQAMLVALVMDDPETTARIQLRRPRHVGRSKVLQAEAYIEAHWDEPLSIELIAKEAACSFRTLFKSFQVERGYSPIVFLRRKRLEHAQRMLMDPQIDTSVANVATTCGFSNAGHFARYYKQQFGELPSETLRLARLEQGF